jgi:hypothetical protein
VSEPAVPVEVLPEWLKAAAPTASATLNQPLSDEMLPPVAPEDLPAWLLANETESALGADFLEFVPPVEAKAAESAGVALSLDEVRALTTPATAADEDPWASALDDEFDRRQAGDETVPDWYLEAISRAEEATGPLLAAPKVSIEQGITSPKLDEEPAILADELPAWLTMPVEEATPAAEGVPEWMLSAAPDAVVPVTADELDWLNQIEPSEAGSTDMPEWVKEAVVAAPPDRKPVSEPPAPQPAAAPIFGAIGDMLRRARELMIGEQVNPALEVYQRLIDSSQALEETRADLRKLAEAQPKEPKVRRLLGDTHMRLGDLQSALDAYRSALDQL